MTFGCAQPLRHPQAWSVVYDLPADRPHESKLLMGTRLPDRVLTSLDLQQVHMQTQRSPNFSLGFHGQRQQSQFLEQQQIIHSAGYAGGPSALHSGYYPYTSSDARSRSTGMLPPGFLNLQNREAHGRYLNLPSIPAFSVPHAYPHQASYQSTDGRPLVYQSSYADPRMANHGTHPPYPPNQQQQRHYHHR